MKAIKTRLNRLGQTAVSVVSRQILARRAAMTPEELADHDAIMLGKFITAVECGYLSREEAEIRWPNLVRKFFDEDTGQT